VADIVDPIDVNLSTSSAGRCDHAALIGLRYPRIVAAARTLFDAEILEGKEGLSITSKEDWKAFGRAAPT